MVPKSPGTRRNSDLAHNSEYEENQEDSQAREKPTTPQVAGGKKIVVFADGTGNAFSTQESNVWRLYQALDRSRPDQIARYIQGVGTSGNKFVATLDGITGFGVPSNVRKLYRFICWNWEEGDEIIMFGFSRGAFTIRCLASLIHSQGLMPREIDGKLVTNAEMHANAMGAWRDYRKGSVKLGIKNFLSDVFNVFPTVGLARLLRDTIVWTYRKIFGRPQHKEVLDRLEAEDPERSRKGKAKKIRFMGLFDTVEAYGVPIEELRKPIDYFIWPITFRNRVCSKSVARVSHALSIDDERRTFHPVRFDQTRTDKDATQISEVWFSGMHSDVGGGYPDGSLSYAPLDWMAKNAEKEGLAFKKDSLEHYTNRFSPFAHIHDSRTGLAAFYRYSPRVITSEIADGGVPVVHPTVAQKIAFGSEGYAPIALPDTFDVLVKGGPNQTIKRTDEVAEDKPTSDQRSAPEQFSENDAVRFLDAQPHNTKSAATVKKLVNVRRLANIAMLVSLAYLALLPLIGSLFSPLSSIAQDSHILPGWVRLITDWLSNLLPDFLSPWLNAMRQFPYQATAACLVLIVAYLLNSRLRDLIKDTSLSLWMAKKPPKVPLFVSLFVKLVRLLSLPQSWKKPVATGFMRVTSVIFLAFLLVATAVVINKIYLTTKTAAAGFCPESGQRSATDLLPGDEPISKSGFSPASRCWPTGVKLRKGYTYTLWIDQSGAQDEPFVDRTIPTGAVPFQSSGWRHRVMAPTFRRWLGADWFQPIAQIGRHAEASFALMPIDGQQPLPVPREGLSYNRGDSLTVSQNWKDLDDAERPVFEQKLHMLKTDKNAFGDEAGIPLLFSARFTAPASGELFLYVNDVLIAGDRRIFYRNNAGSATVTVTAVSNPVFPKSQTQDHASFKN